MNTPSPGKVPATFGDPRPRRMAERAPAIDFSTLDRSLVDEPAAEQRMEVLRPLRAHARAEPGGEHDRCERTVGHEDVMAGAGGFEPPVTGPKPAALPLGYAPPSRV